MKLHNSDFFRAAEICTAPGDISDCDECPLNNWRIEKEGENPSIPNYNLCIDYLIQKLSAIAQQKTCQTCKWQDDFSWACCNGSSSNRGDFVDRLDTCQEWERKILY